MHHLKILSFLQVCLFALSSLMIINDRENFENIHLWSTDIAQDEPYEPLYCHQMKICMNYTNNRLIILEQSVLTVPRLVFGSLMLDSMLSLGNLIMLIASNNPHMGGAAWLLRTIGIMIWYQILGCLCLFTWNGI